MTLDQHGTYRLVTGGADKALFFMSQTSDSNFERERWIQTSWPIHDIRGSQNAYVACGKFIQSYDMNGEVLRTFEFERASKLVFFQNYSLAPCVWLPWVNKFSECHQFA